MEVNVKSFTFHDLCKLVFFLLLTRLHRENNISHTDSYIIITIVHTRKYHEFVAVCIFMVCSMSNNANGNKNE